jgi:glycosyltransferase involved in cell wall biosynthesis
MGGGATRAYNMAKGLVCAGCDVIVVTAFPHYPTGNIPVKYRWKPLIMEYMDGLKVFRTFVPPLASEGIYKRFLLFLSFTVSSLFAVPFVGKINVVWAANPNIISVFPSLVYKLMNRCPLVQNVDDLWPESLYDLGMTSKSLFAKFAEFLAKFAYKASSAITPISLGYVKVICGKYGVNHEKVHVVKAGVDLNKFSANDNSFNYDETFRVFYSGAFSMAYDFDQVLLAAKRLENVDGIEFVLQGGGELAGYLKARVRGLKLRNVKIVDKIVNREEVAKLLSEADALILPLRDFGTPYLGISSKLYEYQAVGKPIICCADGQPADYVEKTRSGIVVKPGDYESLAEAVLYLKNNPDKMRELGFNGRRYVKDNVSIGKIGLEMKLVFDQVIGVNAS